MLTLGFALVPSLGVDDGKGEQLGELSFPFGLLWKILLDPLAPHRQTIFPVTSLRGTGPNHLESRDCAGLSPRTQTCPSGTISLLSSNFPEELFQPVL